MDNIYSNAYAEVYEILNILPIEYLKKIPNELIKLFTEKRNKNYKFVYNEKLVLAEQEISIEAKSIISNLYRDYWSDEEERKEILENQINQRKEYEQNIRELYNLDEIFKKRQRKTEITEEKKEEAIIVRKENFFTKIINKIKNILKK